MTIVLGDEAQARPGRKKRANPEEGIHRAIADYLTLHSRLKGFLWHHSPLGGFRNKIEAGKLKRLGARAGFPDILIVAKGGRVFFAEIKAEDGKLSLAQLAFVNEMVKLSTPYAVWRSVDDAAKSLKQWGLIG